MYLKKSFICSAFTIYSFIFKTQEFPQWIIFIFYFFTNVKQCAVIYVFPRDLYSILIESVGFPINKHILVIKSLEDINLCSYRFPYQPSATQFYKLTPEEGNDTITTLPDIDINADYRIPGHRGTEAQFQQCQ